jgi:hypothetical protein
LASAWTVAVWADHDELAGLRMLVEFVLAREDLFASCTLEVISHEMLIQQGLTRAIKVATRLQAMLVL